MASHKINFAILASAAERKHWPALPSHQATKTKRGRNRKGGKKITVSLTWAEQIRTSCRSRSGPLSLGACTMLSPRAGEVEVLSPVLWDLQGRRSPRRKQPHRLRFSYLVCPRSHSHQGLMYIHTMLSHGEVFKREDTVGRGHGSHRTNGQS